MNRDEARWFHVTVKGLVHDEHGRVLMLHERSGFWDLPGGRLEHGETFADALRRECREEMGVDCAVLDAAPRYAWSARDRDGVWRVMLCFAIRLESIEFHESDECIGHAFFPRERVASAEVNPQTRPLAGWL
jgi:8-oxo-dGTP pyrophosphatase MutT (NUDIX family)